MSVEKYGQAIQKSFFAQTSKDSIFSHTRNNSKMFNITPKHFSFFNNKPSASLVTHITRHSLTCYSCSYYSSMLKLSFQSIVIPSSFLQQLLLASTLSIFMKVFSFLLPMRRHLSLLPFIWLSKHDLNSQIESFSTLMQI